jgi:hypothetical protein
VGGDFDAVAGAPPASAAGGSAGDAQGSTNSNDHPGTFPVAPVAGGAAVLVAGAVSWLVGAKRTAARAATSSSGAIPHGGVRPPR